MNSGGDVFFLHFAMSSHTPRDSCQEERMTSVIPGLAKHTDIFSPGEMRDSASQGVNHCNSLMDDPQFTSAYFLPWVLAFRLKFGTDHVCHVLHEPVGGETVGADDFIPGGGGEAGVEGDIAIKGLLGEGNSFDGDLLLMVDGLVGGDGFGLEDGELVEVVEADGAEFGRSEPVLAGVLRGAGFALRGARSSGASGVGGPRGHPGDQALFGDGCGLGIRRWNSTRSSGWGPGGEGKRLRIKGRFLEESCDFRVTGCFVDTLSGGKLFRSTS
jgi:hypothetical protein